MRKIFFILIFLSIILVLPASAEDESEYTGGIEDAMKYSDSFDNAFAGQKKVTDEDFEKALEQVKSKQKKKKKDKLFKGKSLNEEDGGKYIDKIAGKNLLLRVPVCLINGDGAEIPIGHYKILGKKKSNQIYLDFFQSSKLIASVPAIETNNDFNKTEINFVQLIPYNEERIKIIYGSIDFNAYSFINIKKTKI